MGLVPVSGSIMPRTSSVPVTITGTVTDSSGRPARSGFVEFSLQPSSQALAYSVLPDVIVATPTRARITDGGQLVSDLGTNDPFVVWPNDLIIPGNSLYQIVIAPHGRVTRIYQGVLIQSDVNPQSLAELTFVNPIAQVVGTIVNGNPLISMSVIPGISDVWTVGDRRHWYLRGFFRKLFASSFDVDTIRVKNLYAENYFGPSPPIPPEPEGPVPYTYAVESSNVLGQPQPGQIVLLFTGFVQTIFPANFNNPTSYGRAISSAQNVAVYTCMVTTAAGTTSIVGTVSTDSSGMFTFQTSGFTLNPGDIFWVTAPNPMDPTLSDVALSFVGTRTS